MDAGDQTVECRLTIIGHAVECGLKLGNAIQHLDLALVNRMGVDRLIGQNENSFMFHEGDVETRRKNIGRKLPFVPKGIRVFSGPVSETHPRTHVFLSRLEIQTLKPNRRPFASSHPPTPHDHLSKA